MKNIYVLGIGGTFMGGVALLARAYGFKVSGADEKTYPPMSTQLAAENISFIEGYDTFPFNNRKPDAVIVGNSLRRGKHPVIEILLNQHIPYFSGPAWIAHNILRDQHVIAVAGTHGKTTTAAMIAFMLDRAGLSPGFLIGGVPHDFNVSARKGNGSIFVIEADEYDTAFFDKRPKFMHYRPDTLVLNNLEYDHADIYPNLQAIKQQFAFLLRTVPSQGRIIAYSQDKNLRSLLATQAFTPVDYFGSWRAKGPALWQSRPVNAQQFEVYYKSKHVGRISWALIGEHCQRNALAALAAVHRAAGLSPPQAIKALCDFKGVKRRMEIKKTQNGITLYEDFAHHPTAIAITLEGLRKQVDQARIICVLECASHSMRMGIHYKRLPYAWRRADQVLLLQPRLKEAYHKISPAKQEKKMFTLSDAVRQSPMPVRIFDHVEAIVDDLKHHAKKGDHIVVMSNGGFGGLVQTLSEIF